MLTFLSGMSPDIYEGKRQSLCLVEKRTILSLHKVKYYVHEFSQAYYSDIFIDNSGGESLTNKKKEEKEIRESEGRVAGGRVRGDKTD